MPGTQTEWAGNPGFLWEAPPPWGPSETKATTECHGLKWHLTKGGQDLTKVAESSLGTEKQRSDIWLPRPWNSIHLRCRFLSGCLRKCHLTPLSCTVLLFKSQLYLMAFCSSSICSLTCCSSFSSSRSVPFTQVYTTSIGMGRQSLGKTHKSLSLYAFFQYIWRVCQV